MGFAWVVMTSLEEAYTAKETFNGYELHGKTLQVKGTKPRDK
jgi:RNA recognition motif-containing protein